MTRLELLAHVEKIPGWRMTRSGKIRNGTRCPITKVCKVLFNMGFPEGEFSKAAHILRLAHDSNDFSLAEIADNSEHFFLSTMKYAAPSWRRAIHRQIAFRRQMVKAARVREIAPTRRKPYEVA